VDLHLKYNLYENKYITYSLSYVQERMSNLMDSEITISKAVNDVSVTFSQVSECYDD
jgi:methyl-accepting chemotaxis protein